MGEVKLPKAPQLSMLEQDEKVGSPDSKVHAPSPARGFKRLLNTPSVWLQSIREAREISQTSVVARCPRANGKSPAEGCSKGKPPLFSRAPVQASPEALPPLLCSPPRAPAHLGRLRDGAREAWLSVPALSPASSGSVGSSLSLSEPLSDGAVSALPCPPLPCVPCPPPRSHHHETQMTCDSCGDRALVTVTFPKGPHFPALRGRQ